MEGVQERRSVFMALVMEMVGRGLVGISILSTMGRARWVGVRGRRIIVGLRMGCDGG